MENTFGMTCVVIVILIAILKYFARGPPKCMTWSNLFSQINDDLHFGIHSAGNWHFSTRASRQQQQPDKDSFKYCMSHLDQSEGRVSTIGDRDVTGTISAMFYTN
eukprot:sb/3477935/